MAKTINLSLDDNGKMLKVIVDDEDYEWLNSYLWHARSSGRGGTQYATCSYAINGRPNRKKININMHHVLMGVPLHGLVVDHINNNSLDNRKENLRIVSVRQNNMNSITYRGHISHVGNGNYRFKIQGSLDKLELIRDYAYKVLERDGQDN